jgi:hypothetical protein
MSVLNDIMDTLSLASARSHAFPVSRLTMITIVTNITIPVKICSVPGGEWDSFVLCPLNLSFSRLFRKGGKIRWSLIQSSLATAKV